MGVDAGLELGRSEFEGFDLFQVQVHHEGVMGAEVALERLDQFGLFALGLADGKPREPVRVALTLDQALPLLPRMYERLGAICAKQFSNKNSIDRHAFEVGVSYFDVTEVNAMKLCARKRYVEERCAS